MHIVFRLIIELLKNWEGILALATLVLATGFSFTFLIRQAVDSLGENSWVFLLALVPISAAWVLGKYAEGYWSAKKNHSRKGDHS